MLPDGAGSPPRARGVRRRGWHAAPPHPFEHLVVEPQAAEQFRELRFDRFLAHMLASAGRRVALALIGVAGGMIIDVALLLDLAEDGAAAGMAGDQTREGEVVPAALGFAGEATVSTPCIAVLREQEAGAKTSDVCRKHGVSQATFYKSKAKYGGLEVSEARRLRALEEENGRLKKLFAEGNARQRHVAGRGRKKMVTPAARREAAAHLREVHGVSQRRACQALGVDRSSVRYRSRRDDGEIRVRLREIAPVRRRFGYRRLHILLRREGLQGRTNAGRSTFCMTS